MIGDWLHDTIARRREARRPKAKPEPPRPEGVALYICRQPLSGPAYEDLDPVDVPQCGRIQEAKPYVQKPRCHGQPMAIYGYDWERDVA